MTYLLDTNVISELIKPKPEGNVIKFLSESKVNYLSAITIFEIQYGRYFVKKGKRPKKNLEKYVEEVTATFKRRLLDVGLEEALLAGKIKGELKSKGKIITSEDAIIAASAMVHDLTLVTRNTKDFKVKNLKLYNPWND